MIFWRVKPLDAIRIEQFQAVFVGDGNRSDPFVDDVAIRMVAVIVRIKHVANGFIRCLANFFDDFFSLLGEIRFNDEHEILENDPPVVAANELGQGQSLAKEDAGRNLGDLRFFGLEPSRRQTGHSQNRTTGNQSDQRTTTCHLHSSLQGFSLCSKTHQIESARGESGSE